VQKKYPQVNAQSFCGKSVAEAHRTFVENRVKSLEAYAAWMDKNSGSLKVRMATKPIQDATDGMSPPAPLDLGLPMITQNECIARYFKCPSLGCSSSVLNLAAGLPDR
jgi:hypothetical protein